MIDKLYASTVKFSFSDNLGDHQGVHLLASLHVVINRTIPSLAEFTVNKRNVALALFLL